MKKRGAEYDRLLADLDRQYKASVTEDARAQARLDSAHTDQDRQETAKMVAERWGLTAKIQARRDGAFRRRMELNARSHNNQHEEGG